MMDRARRAEALGYESVWLAETRFTRDAVTTAAAVAAATTRVRVGTAVVNPFTRGAVLTAVTFATLDELADGRFVLGIGPGSPLILERQGLPFDRPLTRMREYIEVTRRLLAGEAVTYEGTTLTVRDVRLDFRPRRATVPVYLGVTGPRALALAGQIADGVILNSPVSVQYIRRAVERVRQGAVAAGRSPADVECAASIMVAIDHDAERARDAIRPLIAIYLANFPNIAQESGLDDDALARIREAFARGGAAAAARHVADAVVDDLTCAGTPEECHARLADRRAAGVTLPIVSLAHGEASWALAALAPAPTGG
jgi:5,10-methylenetetrahydromethanopterin reductase